MHFDGVWIIEGDKKYINEFQTIKFEDKNWKLFKN